MNIWLLTDTHFFHENIKIYEGRPDGFEDMIIKNCNSLVKEDDLLIHTGDILFGFNKDKNISNILARLPGKKVLIRGNHDAKEWEYYLEKGFDFVCDYFVYKNTCVSHAPITPLPHQTGLNHAKEIDINYHGHFHKNMHRATENDQTFGGDWYDYDYYKKHQNRYKLLQIEDSLSPFLLET